MYVALIGAALFYKDELISWVSSGDISDIPLMLLVSILFAFVPVVPFGVIGGMMGAKYGIVIGGLLNISGSSIASLLMLLLVRTMFREQGRKYLSRFRQMEKFTVLYEKHPFLGVLTARLIPFMPAPVINVYSALSRIPVLLFMAATILGKIPVMFFFALVGETVRSSPQTTAVLVVVYVLFLGLLLWGYRIAFRRFSRSSRP
ncbi:VTT domain-containing protein [Paenibacillus filicis]|uniref:TVP38/TMEM64 family membrane protein n=2 Tax=Paenibacillus filicis TaxID=669464 RepID=A0ABU9DCC3_9BACL